MHHCILCFPLQLAAGCVADAVVPVLFPLPPHTPSHTQDELKDMLNVQEGFVFSYQDVVDDRRKLEL